MNRAERIATLMFRHVRKELTRQEKRALTAWRSADQENEKVFQGTINSESILINIAAFLAEKERGLQILKDNHPEIWGNSATRPRSKIYRIIRYAAVILVVLGFSLYYVIGRKSIHAGDYSAELISTNGVRTALSDFQRGYLAGSAGIKIDKTESGELIYNAPNDSKRPKDAMYSLRTDRGGEFILKLPDGSMVRINSETSIQYPANFSQDTINVSLEGEAYFEIPNTAAHHFRILLQSTVNHQPSTKMRWVVETSGAELNLSAYSYDSLTYLTLINGTANLTLDSAGNHLNSLYELKPGQQARFKSQNPEIVSDVDTAAIVAWNKGLTIFHDASIQTIMQMVSRWYNVDVHFVNGIPEKKFNINIPRNADLTVLLASLKKQGLLVSVQGKTVTVVK